MNLGSLFSKENIMSVKATISDVMEKKGELDMQMSDFKSGIEDIKASKEKISTMISDMNKKEVKKTNRIYRMVEEKRNK